MFDTVFENSLGLFYAGAFVAGISSFAHCFFMCGPINMLFRSHAYSYQAGRILGYTVVGGILGSAGPALDRAGILVSVQNLSIYAAAFLLLVYAVIVVFNIKIGNLNIFKKLSMLMVSLRKNPHIPSGITSGAAGTLSALIPCSVLYPVWILASSSGSVMNGSIMAFSFVLGTVPALFLFQIFSNREKSFAVFSNKYLRNISTILLISISLFVLYHRKMSAPVVGQEINESEEICE